MANHVNGLDEIDMEYTLDAWGDVPPLHARELYAQYDATRAEFVAPDTCHKLHARIAELERERNAARQELENAKEVGRMWYEDICEIKRALAEVGYPTLNIEDAAESVRRLGQERHTAIDNMHENADIADEFICLFKKANEAKREWRNKSKDESQWEKHYHDDWIKVRDERDAANKRAKEYVGVFKRVNAAKRVWRKRAEQAEAFRSAFAEWILRQSEDVKFSAAMALGSEYLDGAK